MSAALPVPAAPAPAPASTGALSDADVAALRMQFPVLRRGTYLANHTLGAMPAAARERLAAYTDLWAERGVAAWEVWAPEVRRVADLVAAIIGAAPGTVVLRQNVADALAAVASCLDLHGRRNRIVYGDEVEWPGSHYLWHEQARQGADVVTVPISTDGGVSVDIARLVEAIDERTCLVYVSQVLFRTATLIDVPPVVARAHEVGALVLLDAYQAAGILPVEVAALGVDLAVGGSVKYLCGGPGAGWLYAAPAVVDRLRPTAVGWWGSADPFGFHFTAVDYAPGVGRFAGGTPGVSAAYAAAAGYEAVLGMGVARIRERSLRLTGRLLTAAAEHGWAVRTPLDPAVRGGHVTLDVPDGQRVTAALLAAGVTVDHRPGAGIRVGPHAFSTDAEIDHLVAGVDAALRGAAVPPPVA